MDRTLNCKVDAVTMLWHDDGVKGASEQIGAEVITMVDKTIQTLHKQT